MTECPVCGHESSKCWRCEECGKDLVDTEDTGEQELVTDGGEIVHEEKTTDEIVMDVLAEHADHDDPHGVSFGVIVDEVLNRTELHPDEVADTINWMHMHGEIYAPKRGYFKRTDPEGDEVTDDE